MATSVSGKKTKAQIPLLRLSADAEKAAARAEAAKEEVRSAKAELKKARKLSKLAKKAAKFAKKKVEAAHAAVTPKMVKMPRKPTTPGRAKPAKATAANPAAGSKSALPKAAATKSLGIGATLRKPPRPRASAADVAKAVIDRMATKRAKAASRPVVESPATPAIPSEAAPPGD